MKCLVSIDEEERYLSIKYLKQAYESWTYGKKPTRSTLNFLVAMAKSINSEKLSKEDTENLTKVNVYETIDYSPIKEGHYLREHIETILIKSAKFDLFIEELQNMQDRLTQGKEHVALMENIVEITAKYLPEKMKE